MKVMAAIAALVAGAVLVTAAAGGVAAGSSSRRIGAPLRQQLAKVARELAAVMNDSRRLKTARVYGPASYQGAMKAWSGGASTNRRPGRYYVVVIRGRFICASCPAPPGRNGQPAPARHYSIASRPWSPTTGNNGVGLSKRIPASMSQLGRPTMISLR